MRLSTLPDRPHTRIAAGGVVGSCLLVLALASASPTRADTAPTDPNDPRTPETVAADALPTVQVNGVVWQQTIIGSTVYAVGAFTRARPAGAAKGTREVVRNNALAYDITTGALKPWSPSLNAQALSVTRSPDGGRVYVGGDFTSVGGTARSRVAALDPTSGAVIGSFAPRADSKVRALAATASTVFIGGNLSSISGVSRPKVAAVRASDAGVLPFRATVSGGNVNALVVSPDAAAVVIGGSFTSVNGSSAPGYGLAQLDASTGATRPFAANAVVRNGGPNSAITGLASDGSSVYGSGYVFGSGGNTEGLFRATWAGGVLQWVDPCHGDSYAVYPRGNDVYKSSHAHECQYLGGFPNRSGSWWHWHGLAMSKTATQTVSGDNHAGKPAPSLLHWFPQFTNGSHTGQNQATWTVTGNGAYVVMGGEFPTVNGVAQQGLVRFAARTAAPNKRGGMLTGSKLNPRPSATGGGRVTLTWPSNWDQDNRTLTYQVVRDGSVRHTVKKDSTFWQLPSQSWQDSGLTAGRTYGYRVFSTDPFGNQTRSDTVTVTAR